MKSADYDRHEAVTTIYVTFVPRNPEFSREIARIQSWAYTDGQLLQSLDGLMPEPDGPESRPVNAPDTSHLAVGEEIYRTLFDFANDAIMLMDGETFVDCNEKAQQVFGRTRSEIIGVNPWDISPDYQPNGERSNELGRQMLSIVYDKREPARFEWQHSRTDGSLIDMDISLAPIRFAKDRPMLIAIARDVTEEKQSRAEIERRADFQSRLASLSSEMLFASPDKYGDQFFDAIATIGRDYNIDRISMWWISDFDENIRMQTAWQKNKPRGEIVAQWKTLDDWPWAGTTVEKGEIIRIHDRSQLPPEAAVDRAHMREMGYAAALLVPVVVNNATSGCCVFMTEKANTWPEHVVEEIRQLVYLLANVTARVKETAERLRRESDLRRSQEAAQIGSFSLIYDTPRTEFSFEGRFSSSDQFKKLFGLDSTQNTPEDALEKIHPDDRQRAIQKLSDEFLSGNPVNQTIRVMRPDGEIVYLADESNFLRDEQNRATGWHGTIRDVTQQVESRNELEAALAEIRQLKDQLQDENVYLRQEVRTAHGFHKIIGDSPALRKALTACERVAPTDVPVLILGETGTGKELIAQSIHDLSSRKDKPLISVNCAALSAQLVESELFGHEKGAFTGANSQRKGRFELADGGTLFLDEIGELTGEQQAKLLRALQSGEFERIGGTRTLKVDVRVIAATNKDLIDEVDRGEFRADLYYRISNFPVKMPPLRDRRSDIPALAEHLVKKHSERMGKQFDAISARTLQYLGMQDWPGNVRELEGFIQRALIVETGPILDYSEQNGPNSQPDDAGERAGAAPMDLRSAERSFIIDVLERTNWVVDGANGAAAAMGVPGSTLRSKMKRLGIRRPS